MMMMMMILSYMLLLLLLLQSHQSSSGLEARCTDSVVIAASNWKHRPHLLHVFHHLWHPRRSGLLRIFAASVYLQFASLLLSDVTTFSFVFLFVEFH